MTSRRPRGRRGSRGSRPSISCQNGRCVTSRHIGIWGKLSRGENMSYCEAWREERERVFHLEDVVENLKTELIEHKELGMRLESTVGALEFAIRDLEDDRESAIAALLLLLPGVPVMNLEREIDRIIGILRGDK